MDDDGWKLREGLILAAFLALVAVAVVTVVLPELRDEPATDGDRTARPDAGT